METRYELQMKHAKEYRKKLVELRKRDPEKAKKESIKQLIKMGLVNEDGTQKEKIVSWE